MRGQRYVGGRRAGKVDDISTSFLDDVRTLWETEPCWVKVGPGAPVAFVARLELIGVPFVIDVGSRFGAQLFDGYPPDVDDHPDLTSE